MGKVVHRILYLQELGAKAASGYILEESYNNNKKVI